MDSQQGFSDRLRRALKDAGVNAASPSRLALEFGLRHRGRPVSVQAVRKWLGGQSIPAQDKLLTLADWLGVSSEWLRYGDDRGQSAREAGAAYQVFDLSLCGDIQRLNEDHRRIVRELVTALLRIEGGR